MTSQPKASKKKVVVKQPKGDVRISRPGGVAHKKAAKKTAPRKTAVKKAAKRA
jgi:hypothetical protein